MFVASQVRCTAGLACTQRLGPGVENMPGELEIANISPHHTIVCRLEHDGGKLEEGGMVYVQVSCRNRAERIDTMSVSGYVVSSFLRCFFEC